MWELDLPQISSKVSVSHLSIVKLWNQTNEGSLVSRCPLTEVGRLRQAERCSSAGTHLEAARSLNSALHRQMSERRPLGIKNVSAETLHCFIIEKCCSLCHMPFERCNVAHNMLIIWNKVLALRAVDSKQAL